MPNKLYIPCKSLSVVRISDLPVKFETLVFTVKCSCKVLRFILSRHKRPERRRTFTERKPVPVSVIARVCIHRLSGLVVSPHLRIIVSVYGWMYVRTYQTLNILQRNVNKLNRLNAGLYDSQYYKSTNFSWLLTFEIWQLKIGVSYIFYARRSFFCFQGRLGQQD